MTHAKWTQQGTVIYLGKGGFDVRNCPDSEALAERIVTDHNALVGISDPVAWVMAIKEVHRLTVAGGFPVDLANAWLDAKAAEGGA